MTTHLLARTTLALAAAALLTSAAWAGNHGNGGNHNHSASMPKSMPGPGASSPFKVNLNQSVKTAVPKFNTPVNLPTKNISGNATVLKLNSNPIFTGPIKTGPIKTGPIITTPIKPFPIVTTPIHPKPPVYPFPKPPIKICPPSPFPPSQPCHHHCNYPWWLVVQPRPYPVGYPVPIPVGPVFVPPPVVAVPAGAKAADLVISEVKLLDAGDPAVDRGPTFRVTVKNVGQADATKFDLSIYASLDDKPSEMMIAKGTEIDSLPANSAHTVELTLHPEALGMKATPESDAELFKFIFAVADGKNETVESDKRNNVLIVKRDEIRRVESAR